MDSLSQIALGGAVGELVLGKKIGNKAILVGAFAGTIPDLDILLNPFVSEATALWAHRGPTHSVFFAFIAAPILGWLWSKFFKNSVASKMDWTKLFFWGLWTHPMLDLFTMYGTGFFEPFSNYRVGFNSIFIIDPLYTLPLLFLLIAAMFYRREKSRRRTLVRWGLIISTCYLIWSVGVKQVINSRIENSISEQNIPAIRYMSAASIANTILWRGLIETEDAYYEGFNSIIGSEKIVWHRIPKNPELMTSLPDSEFIQTLKWFSKDYLHAYKAPDGTTLVSDLRFGRIGFEDGPFIFSWGTGEDSGIAGPQFDADVNFKSILKELFDRMKQ